MSWLQRNKQIIFYLLLLLLVSSLSVAPLFHNGFFVTDDGEWMIIRFSAFYQAFADGQFPVRFLHRLNFDYGYPVATFLYPGFMYAATILHIIKINFVDSIKIIIGLSLISTTLFTYLWLTKIFVKNYAALMGAVASLYIPYHLYDSYTRGSVGELFALVWVPFILWMIERKNIFFISVGICLLLISHNTMALLFLPILFLYAFLRKQLSVTQIFLSFLLGILLSSFFIFPAVLELGLTQFANTTISIPTEYFADIKLIGWSTVIIIFLSLLFLLKKKLISGNKNLVIFFGSITVLTIFLSSSLSSFIWPIIPASVIQFPFRLLSYSIISVAFLAAFCVSELNNTMRKIIIVVGLAILLFVSAEPFLFPKEYFDKGEGAYATNDATTTVKNEYMPRWVKEKPLTRPESKIEIIKGQAIAKNINYDNKTITFTIDGITDAQIRINTIHWPGWNIFIDNVPAEYTFANKNGLIEFVVPKGQHQVTAVFGETSLRLVSDGISVVSLVLLVFYSLKLKKKK